MLPKQRREAKIFEDGRGHRKAKERQEQVTREIGVLCWMGSKQQRREDGSNVHEGRELYSTNLREEECCVVLAP